MSEALLQVQAVSKHFGGFTALSEVSVEVMQGERFGLIGPNGSGKTTLINCVSGTLRNEGGAIVFAGEEISGLPASRHTTRCEKRITACMMCSIMMIVIPVSFSLKRMSSTSLTSLDDSPAIASSEISRRGFAAMARASSSLRSST